MAQQVQLLQALQNPEVEGRAADPAAGKSQPYTVVGLSPRDQPLAPVVVRVRRVVGKLLVGREGRFGIGAPRALPVDLAQFLIENGAPLLGVLSLQPGRSRLGKLPWIKKPVLSLFAERHRILCQVASEIEDQL